MVDFCSQNHTQLVHLGLDTWQLGVSRGAHGTVRYCGLFPYNGQFRNHARLIFTYILGARSTDYMETYPCTPRHAVLPTTRRWQFTCFLCFTAAVMSY